MKFVPEIYMGGYTRFACVSLHDTAEMSSLLAILKAGINTNPLQNKQEGKEILLLINELEAFLQGE